MPAPSRALSVPMRAARLILAVAMVLLVAQLGAGASTDSERPVAAVAYVQPGGAYLTWAPGAGLPDSYILYGVRDGTFSELTTVPADVLAASVSGTYPTYAVAAVMDGIVTPPTVAPSASQSCVTIDTDPPDVAVGRCIEIQKVRLGPEVQLP